jgi:Protein of unknwon function (DUF3310)
VTANKCNSCFYARMDKELEAPCVTCTGYSNYVSESLYASEHTYKPLNEAIDEWFKRGNGVSKEDFWIKAEYDTVSKPKHYMLFEKEGIEVRDVIEKLVEKIDTEVKQDDYPQGYSTPMFIPDYVQMMQYLMRFMDKNGVEDLKKARWYLDKLIDAYESYI